MKNKTKKIKEKLISQSQLKLSATTVIKVIKTKAITVIKKNEHKSNQLKHLATIEISRHL